MVDTQKDPKPVTQGQSRAESYCTHHCVSCGAHFSSLGAFDAHRRGNFAPNERHCVGLEDLPEKVQERFIYRNGVCRLAYPGQQLEGILVWGAAGEQPEGIHNA